MRIVIDMQGAQTESRFRGIGRYTLSFVKAVVRNRGEHEVLLALSGLFPDTIEPIRAQFDGLLSQNNILVWYAPGQVNESSSGSNNRRCVAELVREAFLVSLQPDVIHVSSLFEGYVDDAVTSVGNFDANTPVTTMLYDLIPMLNPDQYLKSNPVYAKHYKNKIESLKRATFCLAISESARKEGLIQLGLSEDKIINVSTAIENQFKPLQLDGESVDHFLLDKSIKKPFIFYAGGADERKNLSRLIKAYSILPLNLRSQYQLVFGGMMPAENIEKLKLYAVANGVKQESLIFTGYVTDEALVKLYNLCKVFVFPSWHEGFGLPALEAMACGAAVIAGNTSSLPEVIGFDKALFDPFDIESIRDKIEAVLVDNTFSSKLREHGLQYSRRFSWDKTAKRAIEVWQGIGQKISTDRKILPKIGKRNERLLTSIAPHLSLSEDKELLDIALLLAQNEMSGIERQLFLDISELYHHDSATGVQRVVRSFLHQLLQNPPSGFVVQPVYATQTEGYRYASNYISDLVGQAHLDLINMPISWQRGDIFFGLDMQHHVQIAQANTYALMRSEGVIVKFMVYDLLPIQLADFFKESSAKELHETWLKIIAEQDEAICISKATAEAYRAWIDSNNIHTNDNFSIDWIHMGADLEGSKPSIGLPADSSSIFSILKSRPTFLVVSTLEPRKAQSQILDAAEELWSQGIDINLVFVGKKGWNVDELIKKIKNHSENGRRLFWLRGISDEYLENVYKLSTCLIAASINEGFGLSLIEAARYGKQIIARDIPVFREVAGNSAYYFNGNTGKDLAEAINDWLELQKKGEAPRSLDMEFITWSQSAEKLKYSLVTRKYRRRQLFVDISELVQRDAKSGIQRVVRSLLKEWLHSPDQIFRIEPIYGTNNDGYRYARSFSNKLIGNFSQEVSDDYIEFAPGDIFLGLDLAPAVVPSKKIFYEELQRNGVLVSFVVYDLLPLMNGYFEKAHAEACTRWLDVATSGQAAFCISKTVAEELIEWMRNNKPEKLTNFKVKYFHLGADIESSVPTGGMPQSAKHMFEKISRKPTFLMVSTIAPHKGHQQVLAAFEQIWQMGIDINLVFVGKQGWLVENFIEKIKNNNNLNKNLFWLNDVSDEYLDEIYKKSACLLAASYGEGFGLPLIEAAQHKLPIIARDIPVFREVGGDNVFYFNADSSEDLALSIEKWLALYAKDLHPKSHYINWLTWKESSSQLMDAIKSMD